MEIEFSALWVEEFGDPSETHTCVSGLRFNSAEEAEAYGRKAFGSAYCGVRIVELGERPF